SGWTTAGLQWACEPSSPLGMPDKQLDAWCDVGESVLRVLDCAYAPLRLDGAPLPAQSPGVWQLWTPNKALGLTGVRGAYAIAPQGSEVAVATLGALAPSWPVGAHAAVMLAAWALPDTQNWLAHSRERLLAWKTSQLQLLEAMGWAIAHPGVGNFFCAQPFPPAAVPLVPPLLQALRGHGIKLRDAASFGLPGQVRLAVLSPSAQLALEQAWRTVRSELPKECVDFS
ncbi:MAG: aminotransferase class I/II-fold pyridoxal phosphate-dependent enzyme, partial [Giesbergeria sp.]